MIREAGRKRRLLSDLSGTVLEIGAGTGANFGYLAPGVSWIGLEPHRRRRPVLVAAATQAGHTAEVLAAPAEQIPLAATIVLCSVRDQARTLTEVLRVLRPGGRFVFLEHVAAPRGTWTRRLQWLVAPFSRWFDNGCDPARDTAEAIDRAGFASVELEWFQQPVGFGLTVPCIAGHAWKPEDRKAQ